MKGAEAGKSSFLAHSANEHGIVDPLCQHLKDVAERAALYASAFGASDEALLTGLLHDLGKYGDLFQRRLEGKESGIDHWSAGAWTALIRYRREGIASALAIQGHHLGLQQGDSGSLGTLDPMKLQERHPLNLRLSGPNPGALVQRMEADGLQITVPQGTLKSLYRGLNSPAAAAMLDVRMLYSALVDADFIETERHFNQTASTERSYRDIALPLDPESAFVRLRSYLENLSVRSTASPRIDDLRQELLESCLSMGGTEQGIFTLTAPTGTGKTLAMLALALRHAVVHDLQRVVLVIPYLNIIEQTGAEYRNVFAGHAVNEVNERYVLEQHSLSTGRAASGQESHGEPDMESESGRLAQLLTENWDAPIVLTTSVQFFESLFSNRPAACRKLHRLAKSVILFDEVQTMPAPLVVPTLATLARLAERYSSTVVFATATQPAFAHLDQSVKKYCALGWQPREIVPPELKLFTRAKRTQIKWPDLTQTTTWPQLASRLAESPQALCIVNLKRQALSLYDELDRLGIQGLFHLSTNMCPTHRQATLREVRELLKQREPCRLVSTQCVEAGVDIDFPVVYRAMGPLDAIAQAAGRCNRNGRARMANVHVFLPEDEAYPDRAYQQATSVTRILLKNYGKQMDIHAPDLFDEYYSTLYELSGTDNSKKDLILAIKRHDFAEVARLYRVIDKDTVNVLAPYDRDADGGKDFEKLRNEVMVTGLTRDWIGRARHYAVGLFRPRYGDPGNPYLEPVHTSKHNSEAWFIYLEKGHYHGKKGLILPASSDCIIA